MARPNGCGSRLCFVSLLRNHWPILVQTNAFVVRSGLGDCSTLSQRIVVKVTYALSRMDIYAVYTRTTDVRGCVVVNFIRCSHAETFVNRYSERMRETAVLKSERILLPFSKKGIFYLS